MLEYAVYPVSGRGAMGQVDRLLAREGIRRDTHLDYTCVIYDRNDEVIATGSCFGNTLRCLAVDRAYQGEGLMNTVLSHLTQVQFQRGNLHLFLYTKPQFAAFFQSLGFYEIARVPGDLVFLENRRSGFREYLSKLEALNRPGKNAAIVMNANPFTLGHRYLIEQAAQECDTLHLFVVSEDSSLVPFAVRKRLIEAGTADLKNVVIHETGPYLISSATFPSYFLKDSAAANEVQAQLDSAIFIRIAQTMNLTARYVGQEPTSQVTGIYNRILREKLPESGIPCIELPRLETMGAPVSASIVRECLKNGNFAALEALVPPATLDYFRSEEAKPVLERIRNAEKVVHY